MFVFYRYLTLGKLGEPPIFNPETKSFQLKYLEGDSCLYVKDGKYKVV